MIYIYLSLYQYNGFSKQKSPSLVASWQGAFTRLPMLDIKKYHRIPVTFDTVTNITHGTQFTQINHTMDKCSEYL